MRPRHVVRKATFVNINNGLARFAMRLDPFAEGMRGSPSSALMPEGL